MRQKIISLCCALALIFGMAMAAEVPAKAASDVPMLDGSYLTHEEESVGYAEKIMRGEDLLTGYSKCVNLGPGKLYVGGTTLAAHKVNEVGVAVNVDRTKDADHPWEGVTMWQKSNENEDRVSTNKTLEVEGGYYYRVTATHWANADMSSSFTNGVYIEEP